MRVTIFLGFLLLSSAAPAEVYRCIKGGIKVFTDEPCSRQAQPHQLPALSTVPSIEGVDLAGQYDARIDQGRHQRDQQDKAWLKQHREGQARDKRNRAAIADKRVLKGMSANETRLALGSPDEVEYSGGIERWIYRRGNKRRVVSLSNGEVTSTGGR